MEFFPLSSSQMLIFAETMKHPQITEYCQTIFCYLPSYINIDRIVYAFSCIYKSRPELRTRFVIKDGEPKQFIDNTRNFKVDIQTIEEEQRIKYLKEKYLLPFDLFKDILFRVKILKTRQDNILLVQVHHIIADGYTFASLMGKRDLPLAYKLGKIPFQKYGQIFQAQTEYEEKNGAKYNFSRDYFIKKFKGVKTTCILPSATRDISGEMIVYSTFLSSSYINNWVKQNSLKSELLFMSAFAYVVSAFSGEENVTFATMNNGRFSKKLHDSYGMYVNTMPIMIHVYKEMTILQLSKSIEEEIYNDIIYRHYPYSDFCQETGFYSPIVFNFRGSYITDGIILDDKSFKCKFLPKGSTCSNLTVNVILSDKNFEIRIEANNAKYTPNYIKVFGDAIKNAVINITNTKIDTIADIDLISKEEKNQILSLSYGGYKKLDTGITVVDKILRQAKDNPTSVAVKDIQGSITYAQLNDLSNLLANKLLANKLGYGDFVCVLLKRRLSFPVSVLAILRAGGAYIPIDTKYPDERINYIIKDSRARLLLTSHDSIRNDEANQLSSNGLKIIYIDDIFSKQTIDDRISNEVNLSRQKGIAYMVYTSGTTGLPKGAMCTHLGLLNFVEAVKGFEKLTSQDRISGHRSFSFDAHIEDLFPILTVGGCFCIMPEEIRLNLPAIRNFIITNNITGGGYSTAFARLLLNTYHDLPLRFITGGGEKMSDVSSNQIEIINVYGPTECTDDTSFYKIKPGQKLDNIPIGRPICNSWSFIINRFGKLQPIGIDGELCIAGLPVGKGYWNNIKQTKEHFLRCPFLSETDTVMYKTGDICHWNIDNSLEYVARKDNQINFHGYRIEVEEIEAAITKFPHIKSAAVCVKEINGTKRLCAYFTSDKEILTSSLRKYLSLQIPEYMIPERYKHVSVMPLTLSGKIDKDSLPIPNNNKTITLVQPTTQCQKLIIIGFKNVLNISGEIGIDDSFIELGGDSISAISLSGWLEGKGQKVSVSNILKFKTPRLISKSMLPLNSSNGKSKEFRGKIPVTPILSYFSGRYKDSILSYNQLMLIKADKNVNDEVVKTSLRCIMRKHDILNAMWDGTQLIVTSNLSIEDVLQIYSVHDIDRMYDDIAVKEKESFKINSPLLKVLLYHINVDGVFSTFLAFIANHLIVDAVSWHIILDDLNFLSSKDKEDKFESDLSSSNNFNDYAYTYSKYVGTEQFKKSINHWEYGNEAVHNDLEVKTEGHYGFVYCSLSTNDTKLLLTKCNNPFSTNTGELITTAIAQAYADVFNKNDIDILLESHGRNLQYLNELDLTHTVGWFTTFYPIHVKDINYDNEHDICLIKELSRRECRYSDTYLQYLNKYSKENKEVCIPNIKINYLGNFDNASQPQGLWSVDNIFTNDKKSLDTRFIENDIDINAIVSSGKLFILLAHKNESVCSEDSNKLIKSIKHRLEAIVETTIGSLHTTTPSDLGEMVWSRNEFNKAKETYGKLGLRIQSISPLLPIQESFLYSYISNPSSSAYRLFQCYKLDFVPTKEEVYMAAKLTVNQHPILNENIIYNDVSIYRQIITDRKPSIVLINAIDVPSDNNISITAYLNSVYKKLADERLDIEKDALFKIVAIKLSDISCVIGFFIHHIICDGWSSGIIARDFFSNLDRTINNTQPCISTGTEDTYLEYVHDFQTRDLNEGISYWQKLLVNYSNIATIPTYGDIISDNKPENGYVEFKLSTQKTDILRQRAKSANATFNAIIELSWGLVLQEFTNQKDVVFGEVVSGRGNFNFKYSDAVGPLINTIPIRFTYAGNNSIDQLLGVLHQQSVSSSQWDYIPMSSVTKAMGVKDKFMRTVVAFDNFHDMSSIGEDVNTSFQVSPVYYNSSYYTDLSLLVFTLNGELNVRMTYDYNRYSHCVIESVAHAMEMVLQSLSDANKVNLSDIDFTGLREQNKIIKLGEGGKLQIDITSTVSREISKTAIKNMDKTAVVAVNGTLTYKQLSDKTNALSNIIRKNRTNDSNFVLVLLDRTLEFPVSVLGILKSGMAYVPIASDYPLKRIVRIMKHSGSHMMLTTQSVIRPEIMDAAIENGIKVLFLDEIEFENYSSGETVDLSIPSATAYMIYTSGTTQEPKGVEITNAGLYNFICSVVKLEKLYGDDRISAYRSFSFDAHIIDIFPILMAGGTLFIIPSDIRKDIIKIRQYIISNGITGCGFTTPVTCLLINTYPDLPVRFITGGGDRMEGVFSTKASIINVCGPTECTDDYTSFTIAPGQRIKDIPIGRPICNTWVFVVDGNGKLAPKGAIGEICVAGVQVAKGYWKNEPLTAQKFIQCPFISKDYFERNLKMYKTGDYGRWNSDGQLMFIGRHDRQVKINGYRIETGEVESCLSAIPEISSASVKADDYDGRLMLVAYYTSKSDVSQEKIKEYLSEKLPNFMMPEKFMRIDHMPLTLNGKVDYNALPKITKANATEPKGFTPKERLIAAVVSDCLSYKIGVNDNLISCGMSSIDAMRISVRLHNRNIDIAPTEILSHPFISDMASMSIVRKFNVESNMNDAKTARIMDNQIALLVDWEKDKDAIQYNIPMILHFYNTPVGKVRDALLTVVENHPTFKIHIKYKNGTPIMYIADEEIEMSIHYLSYKPTEVFFNNIVKPFNLNDGKLCFFQIFQYQKDTYLFMDVHHIIFDGYSRQLFIRNIVQILSGATLAKEDVSYISYVDQNNNAKESDYAEAKRLFAKLIGSDCCYTYPGNNHKLLSSSHSCCLYKRQLHNTEIINYCKKHAMTLNTFTMSLFVLTLHRLMQEEKILFAAVTAGREKEQSLNTIGMYVKTLPIVSYLGEKISGCEFSQFAANISKSLSEALSHSYYSFTRLSKDFAVKPDIMFAYEEAPFDSSLYSRKIKVTSLSTTYAKVPLVLRVVPNKKYLSLEFEYDSDLYEENDIRTLANAMLQLCKSICEEPKAAISSISLLDSGAKEEIIEQGKGLVYDVERQTPIGYIKKYSSLTPDAIALRDLDSELTYKDLNKLSNTIANFIVMNCNSQFVGILMSRRKEYVLAEYSTIRAGKAFIPMDTIMPSMRIISIIEDSNMSMIITTKKDALSLNQLPNETKIVFIEDIITGDASTKDIDMSQPEKLAYMIYTSGTSGKPKGVPILTSSLMYFVKSMLRIYNISDKSKIACFSSFSFDASIEDIFPVLCAGGTSLIIPDVFIKDMHKLYNFLCKEKATGGSFPTQFGQMFLNCYNLPYSFAAIGGEKMTKIPSFHGKLFNTYGPTEFTVIATYQEIDKSHRFVDIPIGLPIDNSRIYIVDKNMQLLPSGIVGELCVSGPQLSIGYWKNSELNSKKFISNPFNTDNNGMYTLLFRTGDMCRWNENGEIEYIGRRDSQVKLRGYRIELAEINKNITSFKGITNAYSLISKDQTPHICVFFTSDNRISKKDLRFFLEQRLPEYMVPDEYIKLNEMPQTLSGKVDKSALLNMLSQKGKCSTTLAPKNEKEKTLCKLMSEILGVDNFGAEDDFVLNGGNSLNIMRLQEEYNTLSHDHSILDFNTIFKYRTPRKIAEKLYCKEESAFDNKNVAPLSEMQKMHFDTCMARKSDALFNIPMLFKLSDDVNVERLKLALETVVRNHAIFSTRIKLDENCEPYQLQNPIFDFNVSLVTMSEEDFKKERMSLIKPFRLLEDKLLRLKIINTPLNKYLFMDIHHMIFDGKSSSIFFKELFDAYYGKSLKKETADFLQFVIEEKQYQASEAQESALSWYKNNMQDAAKRIFPKQDKYEISQNSENADFCVCNNCMEVQNVVTKYGVSLNAFLTGTFGLLLHIENNGIDKLAIVNAYNGRNDSRYDESIGVFAYPMFVPCDFSNKKASVRQYLEEININILQSMSSCHISMKKLSGIGINLRDYMQFLYHGEMNTFNNTLLQPMPLPKHKSSSGLPMTAHMSKKGSALFLRLRYLPGLYSEKRIQEIGENYSLLIKLMCNKNSIAEIISETKKSE